MPNSVESVVAAAPAAGDIAPPAPRTWLRWQTLAVCLGLVLVVYLPAALRAEFLAFDDGFFFGPDNQVFQDGFFAVFDSSRPIANAFLPVAHASLWFDWWWFDGAPFGPHLHSLLLHALCGFVFVRLLLRLRVASVAAHLAGALFLLHPALAESVAWVSGRKDLLAGLFTLLALHQTVRFAQLGGAVRIVVILLCAALAMYAKATAVVLPGLALLVCFVSGGRRARFLVPAGLAVLCGLAAWHHQSIAAAEGTMLAGGGNRWLQVPGAYLHYLRTALWPVDLNVLYPEVQTLENFRAGWLVASAVLGVTATIAVWLCARRSLRLLGCGLLFFLVALAPFNTAFPASSIAAADRYLHLALPGLALVIAVAATRWFGRMGAVGLTVLLLPLAFLCGSRAHEFAATETLWRSSLAVEDDNAVAHFNLATELMQRQSLTAEQFAEVESHLDAGVRAARYPIHELRARRLLLALDLQRADYQGAAAHARAAVAAAEAQLQLEQGAGRREQAETLLVETHLEAFEPLRLAGDEDGAAASYAAAAAAVPDHPEVIAFGSLLELAAVAKELVARAQAGGKAELEVDEPRAVAADRTLDAALEAHPDHPSLLFVKASWARVRGNRFAALRDYRRAQKAEQAVGRLRIDPWLEAARMLREQELYDIAADHAQRGLELRDDPSLRQEWAMALVGQGRLDDAIMQLEAYLAMCPDDDNSKKILANILTVRAYARLSEPGGSHEQALRFVERALTYNPKEARAHLVLGRVANERRLFTAAVEHLETAYRLMPSIEDSRVMLTDALRNLGFERLLQQQDLIGAGDAWLRCLEVAPKEVPTDGVRIQLRALWRRHKDAGIERMAQGEVDAAIAEFRRCLRLDPDQHVGAWLLAMALRDQPDVDLEELERLCRQAVAGEAAAGADTSVQTYLLCRTLLRRDQPAAAKTLAAEWAAGEHPAADPAAQQALEQLARN